LFYFRNLHSNGSLSAARDGRKSTVVISQFPVSSWFDMFSDNTYADAESAPAIPGHCGFSLTWHHLLIVILELMPAEKNSKRLPNYFIKN